MSSPGTTYDLIVIGAGPGGYVAAVRAAQLGLGTCVVEKGKPGGVCLNVGCIPTKCLIEQAALIRAGKTLAGLGVVCDPSGFQYRKAAEKAEKAAETLSGGVRLLLGKNGVDLIAGTARLTSATTVRLDDGAELSAPTILIAAGSRPKELPGIPFDGKTVLTSTDVLSLPRLPSRVLIVGGGAIGCEFAFMLRNFGSDVTVVECENRLLPGFDAETVRVLGRAFKSDGISVRTGSRIAGIDVSPLGAAAVIEDGRGNREILETDIVLVAAGRTPNTDSLGLDRAGIEQAADGFIPVGDCYRTAAGGVFAVGDIIDSPGLAHVASREGEIAVDCIAGKNPPPRIDPETIPRAAYTEPQVAGFGLTEDRAREEGADFERIAVPYRACGKAVASGATDGIVKALVDPETKRILGAHIAGACATELIHELLIARTAGIPADTLAETIHLHPTLSELTLEIFRKIGEKAVTP